MLIGGPVLPHPLVCLEHLLQAGTRHLVTEMRRGHLQHAAGGRVGEPQDDASAQESLGQVAILVRRDDQQRGFARSDHRAVIDIGHFEPERPEGLQQVIGHVGISLVDLVQQNDHPTPGRGEGSPSG